MKIAGWEVSLGLYPGIVIGVRSYPEKDFVEHVFYLPLIELCITVHYEWRKIKRIRFKKLQTIIF